MPPVRGTDGPVRGTDPPVTEPEGPFMSNMPLIATVPLMALIVGARVDLLKNGQDIGPGKETHPKKQPTPINPD